MMSCTVTPVFEQFATSYDAATPIQSRVAEHLAQLIVRYHTGVTDMCVVDVGCGTGSYAIALAEMGYKVVGIDLDPEMISLAKEKENKDLDVEFEEMGMLDLESDFSSASFDGIYIKWKYLIIFFTKRCIKLHLALPPSIIFELISIVI